MRILAPALRYTSVLRSVRSLSTLNMVSSTETPTTKYTPPKVWTFDDQADGANKFASINRPTAGARFDRELPVGQHPLQLYSLATPNGVKVTIFLEELLAVGHPAEYDAWLINIMEGDQFGSGFVSVNPNSKIPALVDHATAGGQSQNVFESGSILLYLAEKFDYAFLPAKQRTDILNWVFWQMGAAPFLGGGFGHFFAYANEKQEYPINRFTMEVKRQLDVLEKQLAKHEYIAGDEYTLADIAIWPWYGTLVLGDGYENAAEFLNVQHDYPNVMRWAQQVAERKAVQRGRIVNRTYGKGAHLAERHAASDVDQALAAVEKPTSPQ